MTFTLAHLSDVHLGPLPKVKRRDLLSKRITGYINWYRNRSDTMNDGALDRLVAHMKSHDPDHIAVTGDLVNLALDAELKTAREWLDQMGAPEDVSVVPGNHDTYVPGALRKIIREWHPYVVGDEALESDNPFPYLRIRGNVALLGVNTGRATMPFMATGSFREQQAEALGQLLARVRAKGLFTIILLHHPPHPDATAAHKQLLGARRFRRLVAEFGADLILHGHTHIDSFNWIDGPDGQVPVIGVPAASHGPSLQEEDLGPESKKPGARYNLFRIAQSENEWTCHMQEFGYARGEADIKLIAEHDISALKNQRKDIRH